jgi:hypothetical protein
MGKIIVARKYRLMRDGEKFTESGKKEIRSNVKLDEDFVAQFNATTKTSGHMYEIDVEATKQRDALISAKEAKPVQALDREALKLEAIELGIEFAANIPTKSLIELINEAKATN